MSRSKLAIAGLFLFVSACASIPGKTRQDQLSLTDALVKRTLEDLYTQHPHTKEEISNSVGYVVMNNKITKIPVVGVGGGYGVAVNNKTGEKSYLRMSRFDFGAGWGARSVRPVLIFRNEKKFQSFIDGLLHAQMGAEASAKVGESGAAGGAGNNDLKAESKGYTSYLITDAGVSATVSVGVVRVKPVKLKKEKAGESAF